MSEIRVFFNIFVMSWKEIFILVNNLENRSKPIDHYNYHDYSDFSHYMYYINNNKFIFNNYFKKFNLNVDDLFFYFFIIFHLTKYNYIVRCGIHTIFYNIHLENKLLPKSKVKFDSLFEKHFDIQFKKITINKKIEKYYHFFKNKLKIKIEKPLNNINILFNSTSIVKNINDDTQYTLYFLRKNKSFNKGRYSRNRQNYRTGVYWCLYVNIIVLFGLYFYFYRFTFNFGYLWWLFYFLPASFILPQAIKLRLYNPYIFYNYILSYLEFLFNCINAIFFWKK